MKAEREGRTGAAVVERAHWEEKREKKERTNPSLVEGVAADKAPRSSALFAWLAPFQLRRLPSPLSTPSTSSHNFTNLASAT